MVYKNDITINNFLDEVIENYDRLLDNIILCIDDEVSLVSIGGKGFKLDTRLKDKSHKCKSKTIDNICRSYKIQYISKEEAISKIKDEINKMKEVN